MLKFLFGLFLIGYGFVRAIFSDPVWGLYLFAALAHIRLTQLGESYALPLRIPIIIALVTLVIYFFHSSYEKKFSKWPLETWLLGLMVLGMCASSSQAVYNSELSWSYTYDYLKYLVFFVILVQMLDAKWKVEWFHRVFILSAAWLVYRCWDLRGTTGARFENRGGGYVEDANHFAAALVFLLPFVFQKVLHKDKRIALGAVILCFGMVMSVFISGSRGGFLGLAALFALFFVIYKEHRKKFVVVGTGLAIAGFLFMNPFQKERILSIFYYQQGGEIDASANLRIEYWALSWELFKNNPLLGIGLGNFPYYSGERVEGLPAGVPGHVAHSLWFEILAEGGVVLFVPFVLLLLCFAFRCKRIIGKYGKGHQEDKIYIYTLLAAMGGFLICATFLNRIVYEPMYWVFGLAAAHFYIQKDHGPIS